MNLFTNEEMPELYFYNADELAEYLREVEDHYMRCDWTYGCYKDKNGRYRYYMEKNEPYPYDYLTIKGLCRRTGDTFPLWFGQDQRKPYEGMKRYYKKEEAEQCK